MFLKILLTVTIKRTLLERVNVLKTIWALAFPPKERTSGKEKDSEKIYSLFHHCVYTKKKNSISLVYITLVSL